MKRRKAAAEVGTLLRNPGCVFLQEILHAGYHRLNILFSDRMAE